MDGDFQRLDFGAVDFHLTGDGYFCLIQYGLGADPPLETQFSGGFGPL